MTWLTVKEIATMCQIDESTVKKAVKQDKCQYRYVKGIGRGGKSLRIAVESIPWKIAEVCKEATQQSILQYTGKQQENANYHALIVDMYQKSGLSPAEYVEKFNAENPPEDEITVSQLFRWQRQFKNGGVAGLIDQRGGHNKGQSSISEDVWQYFYNCYMTQQQRSIKLCYDLTVRQFGKNIPSVSAFERKVKKIPQYAIIQYRFGEKALRDMFPSMERCRDDISSNSIWCSDHHLIDNFVRSEDGKKAVRLWLTVFHDMKSNKIVSYLVRNADPNATAVKKCFRLGVEQFGIPDAVYFDNGKDYRSKYFSRDYPMSLVNQLGFNIIYATPYHGQAKPTERFFLTFENRFSKLFPTYAGCNAKKRPECMQTAEKNIIKAAPDFKEYIGYLEQYINEYNNTPSKAEGLNNQCPNKVYFDNLEVKREIKDHHALRILCGTVEERVVHKNGITIKGRTYRSEYLIPYLKEKVYAIIDPDNMDEVNVFDMDNKAICVATATVRTMFRHTTEDDYRRAEKEKKAVRAFNKKYQPTREYTVQELIGKHQFEELQYEQSREKTVVEQINPQITANANRLNETQKIKRIPKDDNIANSLCDYYAAQRKIGG